MRISPGVVGGDFGAVGVDDADLDAGDGSSDRREAVLEQGLVGVEREAVVVGAEERDGAAGLGEAVGVDEVGLGHEVQGAFEDRGVHAGAAVREVPQGGDAGVGVGFHDLDDPGEHRGDHGRVGDALTPGDLDPFLGGEAREGHDAPADVGGAQHRGDARDVERRHRHDRGFVLAGAGELERVEHVREQLVVAQHRGLRRRRRATREQQHRGRLGRAGELARVGEVGVDPARRCDHRGLETRDELVELRVGQPEVQRRVAHPRPRRTEQRGGHDRRQRVDHRDRRRATMVFVDPLRDRTRRATQLART